MPNAPNLLPNSPNLLPNSPNLLPNSPNLLPVYLLPNNFLLLLPMPLHPDSLN